MALAVFGCAPQAAAPKGCVLNPPASIGGPIDLVDETGARVTEKSFAGAPALVYFGYTYCPDVCPSALQSAKAALEAFQGKTAPQVIMISVDPERDTPNSLAEYLTADYFPKSAKGLTGTPEQVAAAAKSFKAGYSKNAQPESRAVYLVDHTSYFYVMDENWRARALYNSNMPPSDAALCMRLALR